MNIIEKDLLDIKEGIICHQVNCQGIMAAGLVLQIRSKYPRVYDYYLDYCRSVFKPLDLLGTVLNVRVDTKLIVSNLFAQLNYGRDKRYTEYDAFETCMKDMKKTDEFCKTKGKEIVPIYFPYKIGCGLAGGEWDVVSKLIEEYLPDAIICKKE